MEKFIILADFTCDLSEEIRNRIGMPSYSKGHIHLAEGRDIEGTLDWSQISREEFYKALSDKKNNISTSPLNAEEYYEYFKYFVEQGYSIINISLSSKISSTYNFASNAAARLNAEYFDARVYCVDSLRMSGAIVLLVIYAYDLKNNGKSFDEIVAWLEDNKLKVHQMGPIDDLFFIARRGRITMGKAIMGSFAGVKPMGDCNGEGYTTVLAKVKGINKALDVTVQYIKETATDISQNYIMLVHSDREAYAKALKEKLESELSPKEVFLSDVFCGCGANIGPGMVGAYYLGEAVSDDLLKEKEVMNNILGK